MTLDELKALVPDWSGMLKMSVPWAPSEQWSVLFQGQPTTLLFQPPRHDSQDTQPVRRVPVNKSYIGAPPVFSVNQPGRVMLTVDGNNKTLAHIQPETLEFTVNVRDIEAILKMVQLPGEDWDEDPFDGGWDDDPFDMERAWAPARE